jgi:hypothetical protein
LSSSDISFSGVFGMHGRFEKNWCGRRNFSVCDLFFVV